MKDIKLYAEAAEQGDADAQYNLGICYRYGQGVDKNPAEAVKWYTKAAEQGDAPAQNCLGGSYANGIGVDKNPAEAVKWCTKAAEQGLANAQHNLGICYYNGVGVEKNRAEAVQWYTKAAEQGYASAQVALKDIQDQSTGFPFKNIKEAPISAEIGELIKSQTSLLWIIPFVFLIMSFTAGVSLDDSYRYGGEWHSIPRWLVEITKFSVSFMSGFLFYAHTKVSKILTKVAATFLIISVIYNPIIPIHFSPQVWCYFDLIVAAIIGIHFYYAKRQLLQDIMDKLK